MAQLDIEKLERQVKAVYRDVASETDEEYHFETGRDLAERLGYPPEDLDEIPSGALDSFAGVGYHFDFADLQPGEKVLDLGSGSGLDVFVAAMHVAETGSVTGVDMTEEQLEAARRYRDEGDFENVSFEHGYIEDIPFDDETFDVAISNGVINLSSDKQRVYEEIHRVLKPDGRVAVSDIMSEEQMPESIKSDEDLWAACIGGAMQIDLYTDVVESAGFEMTNVRENSEYEFVSDRARNACQKYGVKSLTLSANKSA